MLDIPFDPVRIHCSVFAVEKLKKTVPETWRGLSGVIIPMPKPLLRLVT